MKTSKLCTRIHLLGAIFAPLALQAHETGMSGSACGNSAERTPEVFQPQAWGDENASSPTYIQDSEITNGIRAQLASSHSRELRHVGVCASGNGEVVLSGHVRHDESAGRALAIARAMDGVTSVDDEITVKRN